MSAILFFAVLGIILIFLEILLPGVILGVIGGLFLVIAVVLTFLSYGLTAAIVVFFALMVVTVAVVFLGFEILPKTSFGSRIFLKSGISDAKTAQTPTELMGLEGTALTDLHPAGKAEIAGARQDVVAETGYVRVGSRVKVILVEGARIVVREVQPASN